MTRCTWGLTLTFKLSPKGNLKNTLALEMVALGALLHLYFLVTGNFLLGKAFGYENLRRLARVRPQKLLRQIRDSTTDFLQQDYSVRSAWHKRILNQNIFSNIRHYRGVFGSLTASRKIILIQALPAFIAFLLKDGRGWQLSDNNTELMLK